MANPDQEQREAAYDFARGFGMLNRYEAIASWLAEREAALRARIAELEADYAAEVDEFNAGHAAAEAHVGRLPDDDRALEPDQVRFDVWHSGFASGAYDKLARERNASEAARKPLVEALDKLVGKGFVGHDGLHGTRDVDGHEEVYRESGCPRCDAIAEARAALSSIEGRQT